VECGGGLSQCVFETYVLEDWGNAFDEGEVRDAWQDIALA